jgi:hypothetical protein
MVTKYERELERAEVAKRMRKHADEVHAVGSRMPFWRLDDTGDEIMTRDLDGPPVITFHGIYAPHMARCFELVDHRTAGETSTSNTARFASCARKPNCGVARS